ncbi:unnamed protein product [Plutella xylostella]|uniref:(diamondback moth) hypothetical protein n=1 Tax=Plutella xylostella TaxID=51655 RepID=A0A8S4FEI1_PLUXY|nr:unnamed protein product [Plutella xylostella]
MGSHNSHEKAASEPAGPGSGTSTPRRGSARSGSVAGVTAAEPQQTSLVPIEKLGKLLAQRSQKEDGVNGVTENSFTKYVFPAYPELARHFFSHIHQGGKCKNKHMSVSAFRQQCEKVLALLDDAAIIETYVRMFSGGSEEGVSREQLRGLLHASYQLSMDHSPDGPQTCLMINKTLSAVVDACFNKKDSHSVNFVVRWLDEHTHRIIFPLHRYCVHMLSTRHREISTHLESSSSGVELATPVLERGAWGAGAGGALCPSASWLLAAALPPLYSRPHKAPDPQAAGSFSTAWLARLVCAVPSHWVPLYSSHEHGLGANRFLHHTTGYRGATVVLLQAGPLVAVLAAPSEWRETHQYWGSPDCVLLQLYPTVGEWRETHQYWGSPDCVLLQLYPTVGEWRETHQYWGSPDCVLLQLYPTFSIIERGGKMLYLNTSIRGYPKGLRAGSDPRAPKLCVNEDFDQLTYLNTPYPLDAIEVWGCGDHSSRETQLEIKKWQVKEAERQRHIKISAADWIEHPDRYLLEMAGRPQYNNSAK